MTVLKNMTDMDYIYPHIPVLVGSPPQNVSMGVNLGGSLLAAWDVDTCPYCPGKLSQVSTNANPDIWFTHRESVIFSHRVYYI